MISNEFSTKYVQALTEEKDTEGTTTKRELETNYQNAAAVAINKVKQNLATKEIEQRLKQEIDKQQRYEILSAATAEPEIRDNLKIRGNCNTLKMETGKPVGITKIGQD